MRMCPYCQRWRPVETFVKVRTGKFKEHSRCMCGLCKALRSSPAAMKAGLANIEATKVVPKTKAKRTTL
jgi:hypothetical protein